MTYRLIIVAVIFFTSTDLKAIHELDSILGLIHLHETPQEKYNAFTKQSSNYIFTRPELALYIMNEHEQYAIENRDSEMQAFAMVSKMLPYYFFDEVDSALLQVKLALPLLKREASEDQAKVYRKIGLFYHFSNEYDKAISNYLKALKKAEEAEASDYAFSLIYNNLNSIYQTIGNMGKAQEFARKSIAIADRSNHSLMASNYLNLSSTFQLDLDNYDSLKFYSFKALEFAQKGNDDLTAYRTACNLLISALDLDDVPTINRSTKIIDSLDFEFTQPLHQGGYYYAKALKVFNEKNYEEAIRLTQEVLDLGDNLTDGYRYRALAANIQRRSFIALKQFKEAVYIDDLLLDFKDSLYNGDIANKVIELEAEFETKKKELLIEKQQGDLLLLSQEKRIQQLWAFFIVGGLLFLIVILVLIYNRQKLKATNSEINEKLTKEKLRTAELEKSQLKESLEIHQREITSITLSMIRKNEQIEELEQQIKSLDQNEDKAQELKRKIKENQIADDEWNKFNLHFSKIHPGFYDKVVSVCDNCSPNEIRLACLMKMNLTSREIANISGVNVRSIDQNKYRMKKKMNLSEDTKLVDFIRQL